MTIIECIGEVDNLRPNAYMDDQKIRWLSILDKQIFEEIIKTHEGGVKTFGGYTVDTDPDTELLLEDTYGHDVYCFYLESCIDRENAEWQKYNQSTSLFNAAYQQAANAYNRNHKPLKYGNAFLI